MILRDISLRYFRKPLRGPPRPTESQNPPATKKEIPKKTENPDYPQKWTLVPQK